MWRSSYLLIALTLVACEGGTSFGSFGNRPRTGGKNGTLWLGGFPAVPTGAGPSAMVADDFDGDGVLDVVTANNTGKSVSVLLGNGDGTFAPRIDYPWRYMVGPIVAGDFNRDGKPDFAISSWNDASVGVFLNRGKGVFAPQPEIPVAPYINAMVTADLDGDDALDLALASERPGTVSVLYGRGNGSFAANVAVQTTPEARGLAIADFNRDGKLDLAVGSYGDVTLTVLLGTGRRSFATAFTLMSSTIDCVSSIAAGEFTGDSRTDLVVTHGTCNRGSNGTLVVLAGAGDGSFSVGTEYYDVPAGYSVQTPDVDGDGWKDLTVCDGYNLYVFFGQKSGQLAAPVKYLPPVSLGFARIFRDFDGDGKNDVVSADPGTSSVLVVPGKGDRSFAVPPHYGSTWNIGQVLARDLDGDGRLDVVAISREYQVGVFPGNGNGTLGASTEYDVAKEASGLAIGDVDGDGKDDVVVTRDTSNTATILLGRGGKLAAGADLSFGQVASCPVLGDVNGDGPLDLVVRHPDQGLVGVWLGAGDGTFASHSTLELERDPGYWLPIACLALQDLDGDQVLDLVAVDGVAAVARGQGDGTFGAFTRFPMGEEPDKIVVGDLNGDAIADLVTTHLQGMSVALGNGDGSFAAVATYPGSPGWNMTFGAALADLDGDSRLDLIAGRDLGRLEVFFGDGTGAFPRSALYSGAGALAVGDMNGDGRLDVVAADWVGDALTVLLNQPL